MCMPLDFPQVSQGGILHGRRRLRHLQLGRAGQHLGEADANTLNDGQQDSAANGTIARRLVATTDSERATGEEASDDGVVRILLLTDALDGAVKGREEAAPDAEVAAEDRGAHLDSRDGTDATLTVGRVSEALDSVPDGTSDGLATLLVSLEEDSPMSQDLSKKKELTPMQNAPPKSLRMTQGQGSRP